MVWIYTSWLIVLLGVEVVYAHQNIRTFRREVRNPVISHSLKELLALAILQDIAEAFHCERDPWTPEQLAEDLDCPVRVVRELLSLLIETGFLTETAGENPAYLPARELERIAVQDVLTTLKTHGDGCKISRMSGGEMRLREILARVEAGSAAALAGMTMRDLVAGLPAAGNTSGEVDDFPN
jgi:membrane protein